MDFSENAFTKEEQADVWTPLIKAASDGRVDAVRALLAQGADANARDKKGMTALIHGVTQNRVKIVQALVENGADVNLAVDKGSNAGCTALIKAVTAYNVPIVRLLLDHGADANARTTRDRSTALIHAASSYSSRYENTQVKIMELLLTHGADVNAKGKDSMTALLLTVRRSPRSKALQLLLNNGANVNATDSSGTSALMVVARDVLEDIARMLLERGANANAAGKFGSTALMCAAKSGNAEIVKLLMEYGANVNARTLISDTALVLAAENDHDDIVRMLLKYPDIDVNVHGGIDDSTALMKAVAKGNTEVVRALLANDAVIQHLNYSNPNKGTVFDIANASGDEEIVELLTAARDKASEAVSVDNATVKNECLPVEVKDSPDSKAEVSGEIKSLLWEAIREGKISEVIKILLKYPEAVEVVDEFGNTPLHLAAIHSQIDIVGLLLLEGSDVEAADMNNETPLMIAVRCGQSIDIVSSLLDCGANANAARADGWTALMLASQGGHVGVVQLLLEKGADVTARSKDEMTALSVAGKCGHDSIIDALQAELHARDEVNRDGEYVFDVALRGNNLVLTARELTTDDGSVSSGDSGN